MQVFLNILPMFLVIALGCGCRKIGFLPRAFIGPANRLVYYMAIPSLLFLEIARAPFSQAFQLKSVWVALAAIMVTWLFCSTVAERYYAGEGKEKTMATFIQCCVHSNVGYIGLAGAYYALQDEGLIEAGLLSGLVILMQNIMSVLVLAYHGKRGGDELGEQPANSWWPPVASVILNPLVLSVLAGILYSYLGWQLPQFVFNTLKIISNMALPLALLLIGTTLSFSPATFGIKPLLRISFYKLIFLPGIAVLALTFIGASSLTKTVAALILGAPSATVATIMARELGGDVAFASAAISTTTFFSAFTMALWITLLSF
ncbi:MAG: AEC family transporter [Deltaproteobacteria bacterium]|nr:AEC family transporter [Deltaproteobacteria bacterium]